MDQSSLVVECVGPESSGTKWLTELVGLLPGVETRHRSVPYGKEWWPEWGKVDAYVVVLRERESTLRSQERHGHLKAWKQMKPDVRMDASLGLIYYHTADIQSLWVEYEELVGNTQGVLDEIAAGLGVGRVWVPERLQGR